MHEEKTVPWLLPCCNISIPFYFQCSARYVFYKVSICLAFTWSFLRGVWVTVWGAYDEIQEVPLFQ